MTPADDAAAIDPWYLSHGQRMADSSGETVLLVAREKRIGTGDEGSPCMPFLIKWREADGWQRMNKAREFKPLVEAKHEVA